MEAGGSCCPSSGRSQGSLHLPAGGRLPGTLSRSASTSLSTLPLALFYLSLPFPGPGDLPLSLSLSHLSSLSSCLLCSLRLTQELPQRPLPAGGLGSEDSSPRAALVKLVILLIFTVSTGDPRPHLQHYHGARPQLPVPDALKLFAIQCQTLSAQVCVAVCGPVLLG